MARPTSLIAAALAALAVAAAAFPLEAQLKVPPRPKIAAGADTNDAAVYYGFGIATLESDPDKAAAAFYWASRLDPSDADAYYARRTALHLSDRRRLQRYWVGDRSTLRNREVQQIDSLYLKALTINPFFYQKLDRVLQDRIIRDVAAEMAGNYGSALAIEAEIERYFINAPSATKAWRAYGSGQFEDALRHYAAAIKGARKKAGLRVDRGRLLVQLGRVDSAVVDFTLAIEEMRKTDKKDLVFVYESKALLEHSLALAHQRLGNADAAREALGRALQEDLAYAPAHRQLAFLALDAKDTATAVSELDLAVQIAADDDALRYQYGFVLAEVGKHREAEEQLRKAIELNPVHAAPHFTLAHVLAAQQRDRDAAAALQSFLALAPRKDPRREEAEDALKQLAVTR